MTEKLLNDHEFAELMKWDDKKIYRRLASGRSMPKFIKIPANKNRLWKESEIFKWIDEHQQDRYI